MGLLYEKYYRQSDKTEFIKQVNRYSKLLGINPNWLMKVMYVECSLDPTKVNEITSYAGLIQFSDDALSDISVRMGLPKKDYYKKKNIPNMSGSKQMELVYYYYEPYKNLIKKDVDLYIITFYPNADGILGGTLKKEESWTFPKKVATQNPGILKNRDIDVLENPDLISIKSLKVWYDNFSSPNEKQQLEKLSSSSEEETKVKRKKREGYVNYTHTYSEIDTLEKLIQSRGWIIPERNTSPTPTELINYEDNLQSIRNSYSFLDDIPVGQEMNNLRIGTKLKIPQDWIEDRFVPFDGNFFIAPNDDIETFISESLISAMSNKEYRFNGLRKIIPKPKVYIYCKSLGIIPNDDSKPRFYSEGSIIDVSPYIISITHNQTKVGGNFNISLPPLICQCTPEGWSIKKGSELKFGENNFYSKQKINSEGSRNKFLFHEIISNNDVVWISMDNKETSNKGFNVDPKEIVDQYWDLIGLVDTSQESIDTSNGSASINVSGRDLMKLLIEESSYYIEVSEEQERSAQSEGLIVNDNPETWGRPFRVNNSMQLTGEVFSLSIVALRTVGEMFSFIISSLATIEIAPKKIFDGFIQKENSTGEEILSRYTYFDPKDETTNRFIGAGIWSIIKLVVDKYAVNDRGVIDNKLSTHTGNLLSAMRTYADDRFIELYGDTYIDQYYYMVRRPPYNWKSVKDYIEKVTDKFEDLTITDDVVINQNLSNFSGDVYSWYRINLPITEDGYRWPATIWPVVFFREYAEIWGNKALDIQTNYIPIHKRDNESVYMTQLYEDMCYLIQSNAYLPFTRQGQITIKGGNRNIKRGIWIRFQPTGEVFYVDDVMHSYSINQQQVERITILNVSRGMIEYNKSNQYILPFYFKIIEGLFNEDKIQPEPKKEEKEEVSILNVYFDFDSHLLIDKNRKDLNNNDLVNDLQKREELANISEESLNNLVKDLHDNKFSRLKIYGHTDQNGSNDYNLKLSKKRANTIVEEIIKIWNFKYKEKLDRNKIEAIGFGESKPIQTNENLEGDEKRIVDALNRRIEVKIIRIEENSIEKLKNESKKENDFSKFRVNQSIFSFFKTKRNKCDFIEDLESLEANKNRLVSNKIEVVEKSEPKLGKDIMLRGQVSEKPILRLLGKKTFGTEQFAPNSKLTPINRLKI